MENDVKSSVDIKVKINEEDMYYYGKYSFFKRPITTIVLTLNILVLLALLSISILWHNKDVLIVFFVWLGLFFVIIFLTLPKSLKSSAKRSVESSDFKNNERQYIFSNQGIEVKEDEETSITSWQEIYKVVDTKHNFQIYVGSLQAYLIPKRCFGEDNEKMNLLRNIFTSNLAENKIK